MSITSITRPGMRAGSEALPGSGTLTRSVLNSDSEMREQLLGITRSAEHGLAIYSGELSPALYGQSQFLEALKCLVLARRYARVRILTTTRPYQLVPRHPLISMAERLPSLMEIRTIDADSLGTHEFVIADTRALVYRIHYSRWDGMADLNDPAVSKYYLAQFDALWQAPHDQEQPAETVGL